MLVGAGLRVSSVFTFDPRPQLKFEPSWTINITVRKHCRFIVVQQQDGCQLSLSYKRLDTRIWWTCRLNAALSDLFCNDQMALGDGVIISIKHWLSFLHENWDIYMHNLHYTIPFIGCIKMNHKNDIFLLKKEMHLL